MSNTALPRIQAVEAAARQASNQVNELASQVQQIQNASTPGLFQWIQPVIVVQSSAQQGWTTFTNPNIPTSATAVILDGHYQNDSGSNNESWLYIRANAQDANGRFLLYCFSGGPLGQDQSTGPGFGIFPCSNGSFQWSSSNALMSYTVRVIGYVS